MYGVAISASMAVLVVALAAVTLLLALLSYLGPKGQQAPHPVPRQDAQGGGGLALPAARWAHGVQRRPWLAAILATAVLIALAIPALDMRLGFPDAGNDPSDTMTRQAYDLNAEGFGPGNNGRWSSPPSFRIAPPAPRCGDSPASSAARRASPSSRRP